MPRIILTAAALLLSIFTSSAAAQVRSCLKGRFSNDSPVVEIRIALRFQESKFQTDWFLKSLTPQIVQSVDSAIRKNKDKEDGLITLFIEPAGVIVPTKADVGDGALRMTFCMARNLAADESLHVRVADRTFTVRVRPITWQRILADELRLTEGVKLDTQTSHIRYGTMPEIQLLDQTRPDWLVLSNFLVSRDSDRRPMFSVELHNPQSEVQPGVQMALVFTGEPTVHCREPGARPPAIRVTVHVRKDQKATTIVETGDPQFPGPLISRSATVVPEECWRFPLFVVDLGSTGPIVPGFSTIRYEFDSDSLVLHERVFKSQEANDDPNRRDVFRWPWVDVTLEGRIYPSDKSISMNRP